MQTLQLNLNLYFHCKSEPTVKIIQLVLISCWKLSHCNTGHLSVSSNALRHRRKLLTYYSKHIFSETVSDLFLRTYTTRGPGSMLMPLCCCQVTTAYFETITVTIYNFTSVEVYSKSSLRKNYSLSNWIFRFAPVCKGLLFLFVFLDTC